MPQQTGGIGWRYPAILCDISAQRGFIPGVIQMTQNMPHSSQACEDAQRIVYLAEHDGVHAHHEERARKKTLVARLL